MSSRLFVPLLVTGLGVATAVTLTARTQPPAPPRPAPTGNVRDHGAKGDGTADDTAALQAAVDAAPGLVVLPPGTYRITKTVLVDLAKTGFTSVRGDGMPRVVMAGDGPAFKFVGTHPGSADPKTFKDGVWAKERMPVFEGVEIVGDHEAADGIEATGVMQFTVTKVLIRKCRHGIHLTARDRNVLISDSHIYENRGVGVFMDAVNLHQINVTGCHISYCDDGGVVCRAGEVRNLQITGCDIESNQGAQRPPTANVLVESTGGSNAEVAITGCTIQHNHKAAGSANVRIKGPTAKPVKGTDELRDGHVVITGNVISDVMVNIHLQHARGVVITGNTCWTAYEWNVLAENSAAVVVGPNNFDRNPRYAAEERPETTNALMFRDCADCTLSGFAVSRTRATPAALTLERCSRFNVTGLSLLDNDGAGLELTDVTNSRISGCLIRDDRPDAASLAVRTQGGRDNMIVDNYLGRPHEILKGVGLAERNYDAKVKP
ncbi:right-handed parallel beta-helix repeat-containing protein [Gemmata sp.]|uniref:right-handed parallel beta-helix repeat-containing protein n=1 Tax=Gemmata sp. TaxID=1914242 RepID=UPI003F70BC31